MLTYLIGGISRALQQGNINQKSCPVWLRCCGGTILFKKPNNFLDLQFSLCIKNLLTYFFNAHNLCANQLD